MPSECRRKTRSFSLSIGQLTFGSFLLVLAAIATTSIASVVAIRHIDSTFAELQRLRSVGDLAEDIDRRMNELRLAARDFVTDPGTQSTQVGDAAVALGELLKKTRLELAPEQQDMIDGVTVRLSTYRNGIERISALINRRAELIIGLPPLRERFRHGDCRDARSGDRLDPVSDPKPHRLGLAGAQSVGRRTGRAKHAGGGDLRNPKLRTAVDNYAEAIIALSVRERQIADIDREVLGSEGRLIGRVTELLREVSASRSHVLSRDLAKTLGQGQMAEHRARHRRRPDRTVGGAVRGAADRPSAGRRSRPRSARWPEARRTPRFPPPMSATRSAILRGPPKCSVAPWSKPTRRARRRCTRWPSSAWPRKAIASCSKVRSTEFT